MNKLIVLIGSILLLSGCGGTYVYKPISYMSPTKTYEEAKAYCDRKVDREIRQRSDELIKESKEKSERMREDRIAYERANPSYDSTFNCRSIFGGRSLQCSGSSSPSAYNSVNTGHTPSEAVEMFGASIGNALGSTFASVRMTQECMNVEGYERVEVKDSETKLKSTPIHLNSSKNKSKPYSEVQCIKSSPWSQHYQCNDGVNKYVGVGDIENGIFYPQNYYRVDAKISKTTSKNKPLYWGEKFFEKGDAHFKNKDYERAAKWYKKSLDKGFKKAQNSLLITKEKLQEKRNKWNK